MRARIRSVKPEILSDEELWDLGQSTGMPVLQAFEGLWMYADREGRFEWSPRRLKTLITPFWQGDFAALMDALETAGFVVRYEVDGRLYGVVRNFHRHQKPNHREPPSELPAPPDDAARARPGTPGQSTTHPGHAQVADPGTPVSSGKGTEGNGIAAPAPREPADEPVPPLPAAPPMRTPNGVVWVRFKARVVAATGMPPGSTDKTTQAAKSLADWLGQQATDEADFDRRLAVVLDAFFADDWAASKGWPIAALASNPVRYAKTPSSPPGGAGNGTSSERPRPLDW